MACPSLLVSRTPIAEARIEEARETIVSRDREATAREILAAIAHGRMPLDRFTADAHWWWNGGLDLALPEFDDLIHQLHQQMEQPIVVTPGLVIAQGDTLVIEATSEGLLLSGKRYANRYVFLFHFAGDMVREVREYSDSAHVLATFELPG